MIQLLFLLCWPFAAEVADLHSDQWAKRAGASVRLERALPWSLPVAFLPSTDPDFSKRQQRLRSETLLGRAIDFVSGHGGWTAFCDRQFLDGAERVRVDLGDGWTWEAFKDTDWDGNRVVPHVVRRLVPTPKE
jgi:hypothetical protein